MQLCKAEQANSSRRAGRSKIHPISTINLHLLIYEFKLHTCYLIIGDKPSRTCVQEVKQCQTESNRVHLPDPSYSVKAFFWKFDVSQASGTFISWQITHHLGQQLPGLVKLPSCNSILCWPVHWEIFRKTIFNKLCFHRCWADWPFLLYGALIVYVIARFSLSL